MHKNRCSIALSLAVILAAGCTPQALPPAPPAKSATSAAAATAPASAAPSPQLIVEIDSPDRAIKTWWRYLDLKEQNNALKCRQAKDEPGSPDQQYLGLIAQADVLRTLLPTDRKCAVDVYSRDIQEVKAESETRAVVFAHVKNVSPIPVGAEPDEYDKKFRQDGFRFKYVLEKTSSGWKVSQVFKYSETNKYLKKDVWQNIYEFDNKPRYPAFVHKQ
jgi:hypothetical protein